MEVQSLFDGFDRRDWQTATEGTVRFALLGIGWWTREKVIPAIEDSTVCESTVAVSGSAEKAASVVEEVPTVERGITYEAFTDGVATDAYDAVYVCTPNALHLPYVEAAAEYGKHVLCEKPMEASVERAKAMSEAATGGDIQLMIGYRMQTEPAVRRARELVRDGFVGDPVHVSGHMSQRLLEMFPNPDQWRLDPELAGPGTSVTDLGIYPINTARFVTDADPVSATATMHSATEGFDDVPDERATFTVELEGGILASFSASQNAHESSYFTVIGTEGRLTLEPAFAMEQRRTLTVERGETSAEFAFDPVDQMREEFDYFADRVLTDRPVEPDGEHGLRDMRTIEAIYEAAETGTRQSIR